MLPILATDDIFRTVRVILEGNSFIRNRQYQVPPIMFKASTLFFLLFGIVGLVFFGKGLLLAASASRLSADGLQAEAEVLRVDERKRLMHKDRTEYWQYFYTEVVTFTAWDGQKVEARLPEKNEDEKRAAPGDKIQIRYNPENVMEIAPVNGNTLWAQAIGLIVLGLAAVAGAVFMSWKKGIF